MTFVFGQSSNPEGKSTRLY